MTNEPIAIPPERLMAAVDAIYAAFDEIGRRKMAGRPSELVGHERQPRAFCSFTAPEIAEAERFLFRCGLLRESAGSA